MKPTKIICGIILGVTILSSLLTSCGSPPPPPPSQEQKQEVRDVAPPVLTGLQPADGEKISEKALAKVTISGTLSDASEVVAASINAIALELTAGQNGYQFSKEVKLVPGDNVFHFIAKDVHGNTLDHEFHYINGKASRLILEPERRQLPPGGQTFFEVFLETPEGQRQPLAIQNIEIKAQQGYCQGPKYRAPSHSGTDTITAYYPSENARGMTRISVKKPNLVAEYQGPKTVAIETVGNYRIKVINKGQLESLNNRLTVKVPEGFRFVEADKDGKYLAPVREIQWQFPTIGTGVSDSFNFSLEASERGSEKLLVTLESCREEVWRKHFSLGAIGAFKIVHNCERSLVQVGQTAQIQLQLIGNEPVTNVVVTYEFPDLVEFVSADAKSSSGGKIRTAVAGNKIIFSDIASIGSGQRLTCSIALRIRRFGNIKNIATITYRKGKEQQTEQDLLTIYTQ